MKYHFVKIGSVKSDNNHYTWYFKPESVEQLKEHWEKYAGAEMKTGTKEVLDHIINEIKGNLNPHYTTTWGSLIDQISRMKEEPVWKTLHQEENELWNNRLNYFTNGDDIYLSDGLTVFMLTEGITEIKEHLYKDILEFPNEKYTIDDVRYIQWEGGKHWYAKIGNFDIVWEGEQKWNSRESAENAVKKYFKQHYNGQ